MKKRFKNSKPLISKFEFDEKAAKKDCKIDYYVAQAKNIAMYDFLEQEKARLSTPRWEVVSELLSFYKNEGDSDWQSPLGRVLLGIYKKNKEWALHKEEKQKDELEGEEFMGSGDPMRDSPLNTNLLDILAMPETLLLAYKAIKGNKGALSKGAKLSTDDLNSLTNEQKDFYYNSEIFPDGFSLKQVFITCSLLRRGLYPWGSSKRIYFPKPGVKDKKRPITIPPFMDRVIQRAITTILEAVYEPEFELLNRSFGFRPNKSVHDAIVAVTSKYSSGKVTAIEGDIEAAYDTVKKDKLLQILGKKIKDRKFLNLIKDRLDYDYVETVDGKEVRVKPPLGIPQGGIDSPYLFNIYLNELDKFVHVDIQYLLDQMNKKKGGPPRTFNKNWSSTVALSEKIKRKQAKLKKALKKEFSGPRGQQLRLDLFGQIKAHRLIVHRKLKLKSAHFHRKELKLLYVRYADDWILLTNGNKALAGVIKNRISEFLTTELGLKLSEKKTIITNITTSSAHFLGFELRHPARGPVVKEKAGPPPIKASRLYRKHGTIIWASPDRQRLINRLHMKGYCDASGFPRELPWLACVEPHVIIERYNSVIMGFAQFYTGFIRNRSALQRWIHIIRISCIKTLAQKYKTSIPGIYKKFGVMRNLKDKKTITVVVNITANDCIMEKKWTLWSYKSIMTSINRSALLRRNSLESSFWGTEKRKKIGEYPLREGKAPTVTNEDYLEKISWVSLRTQASFDMPCASCGSFENVHQHHIKHVRKAAYSVLDPNMPYKQILALRNRKQIPLCSTCHRLDVHGGKYDKEKLQKFVPSVKLVDNRVLHVESFVKPGLVYSSKALEERGWRVIKHLKF